MHVYCSRALSVVQFAQVHLVLNNYAGIIRTDLLSSPIANAKVRGVSFHPLYRSNGVHCAANPSFVLLIMPLSALLAGVVRILYIDNQRIVLYK